MNASPSLTTRLAILQQGEYEWQHYEAWKKNNPDAEKEIVPKEWTLKLRLLRFVGSIFGPLIGTDLALRLGLILLLMPQRIVTGAYLWMAERRLRSLQASGLQVVAIVGSYAKTTTKHVLTHVLAPTMSTVATPGNINRLLGYARLLFSTVDQRTKVFVVEMGEYNRGEIKTMTQFLRPDVVIVTPISVAHLERFGTSDAIETEIFDALRFSDAMAIVHEQNQPAFASQQLEREIHWYGESMLSSVAVSRAGTEFTVTLDQKQYNTFISLFGTHNAINTLPAFLLAARFDMSVEAVISALASVPIVPHRLEPTLLEHGVLLLDNGYNSNPASAKEALRVLSQLEGSQKVVSTPGFVELGPEQAKYNEELGRQIAAVADLVIVIRSINYDALMKGLKKGGMREEQIISADGEAEGMTLVGPHLKPQAVVLFENSVPELYLQKKVNHEY